MKRIIAFVLLLATFSVLFCACAEQPVNTPDTTAPDIRNADTTAPADTTMYAGDDVPELDFGGTVINIASNARDWFADEVSVEKITGDYINDSVFNRNRAVEERLKVKINNIPIEYTGNHSTVNAIKTAVNSQDKTYDIAYINAFSGLTNVSAGIFANLKDAENLDLTKSYWSQGVNSALELHGAQYAASGAIALSTMRFAFVTVFNKNTFDEKGLDYLYKPVSENTWTLDYQYNISKGLYENLNGGDTPDSGDSYGWITNDYIGTDSYWVSCEIPIIGRNSAGDYEYVLDIERLDNLVTKLIPMYNDEATYNFKHTGGDGEQNDLRKMFSNGQGAMATIRLIEVESADFRDMSDKYGIVPMPKYDEQQAAYHTGVHDQFTTVSIVSTVDPADYPMFGAFLEVMASESNKQVMPAYYETTLKYKYASDPQSWDMLDIVRDSIVIDAGIIYTDSLGKVHQELRTIMQARVNTVSSTYARFKNMMPKLLKILSDSIDKLNK